MSRQLPPRPSLEHLKKQAKELLANLRSGDADAVSLFKTYFPHQVDPDLAKAQLVLARDYGFDSWAALGRFVENSGDAHVIEEFITAALGGQLDTARSLWSVHANVLRRNLVASAMAGDVETVMAMARSDRALLNDPVGAKARPLLTYVCFSRLVKQPEFGPGIRQLVRELLSAGADPNGYYLEEWAGESWRQTPLYGAAGVVNDPELTKLLIDGGADPDDGASDKEDRYHGETLYHACDHPGHNECLRLVLDAKPSKVGVDYCLKRKLDFEDTEGVRVFLDHGADPNSNRSRTALSHAVLRGRSLDMLGLLLSYGADPNVKDEDGGNAYLMARRQGNQDAARLLEEHGANTDLSPYDAILVAASDGDETQVRQLAIDHPEVVQEFGRYGRQGNDGLPLGSAGNVLHDMARLGNVVGLRVLLDLGMDPGLQNDFRETPLHWAALAGMADAAELLINRGSPLDVLEKNHNADPLTWAIWGSTNWKEPSGDYPRTALLIAEAGAPERTRYGGTAEVRELLVEKGIKFGD